MHGAKILTTLLTEKSNRKKVSNVMLRFNIMHGAKILTTLLTEKSNRKKVSNVMLRFNRKDIRKIQQKIL